MKGDYWKKASKGIKLADYPQAGQENVAFPPVLRIAYAVCRNRCGHAEFIVDGSSQICYYCGKMMLRTVLREYVLAEAPSLPPSGE